MKMILLLLGLSASLLMQAQVTKTVENNAGNLGTLLTPNELYSVSDLTITGTIDANDIAIINNAMPALTMLDISNTTISPCEVPSVGQFEANWFPGPSLSKNALNYGGLNKPLLISTLLPSTLKVLGSSAFEHSGITTITIPSSVTSIGWSAFARSSLTTVTIPLSVNYMDEWIFDGCNKLTKVVIEAALTNIPRGSFANCSSLSSVNIPATVTHIGMSAFFQCSSLNTIVLPPSVSTIGMTAFYGCSGLTSIYANNPVPPQTQSSFEEIDKANCTLYVPFGSGEVYAAAPEWKEFTNIVEAPGLSLSSNTVALGPENNSSATINLHTPASWTITSNQEWLAISPASGNHNETIIFTAQANPLLIARTATVTVSTDDGFTETVTVTQSAKANTAPVANAGNAQTVNEGESVQLDGSASADADGHELTYLWTAPEGITLSSSTVAKPTFTAPLADSNKEYTLTLVVNDGTSNSPEAHVVITVLNKIELSVSNLTVSLGAEENLSATVDIHCNSTWEAGSDQSWLTVNPISGNGNQQLTLTAQANGLLTSRNAVVTVTSGELTGTITITQQGKANTPPVANAGNAQTVNEGESVQLDGSASADADGHELTYLWTAPEGITLSSSTVAKPTFTAPLADSNKEYTLTLVVNDGTSNSPEAHVIITVLNKIELSVSNHTVSLGAEENLSATVDIHCNSTWEAGSDQSWLTVNPISAEGNQQLTLTAQANGLLTSRNAVVTVTSGELTGTITITQQGKANTPPVANAGNAQTVNEGETVQLDGSASADADGHELTYLWIAPEGITLSSSTVAKPTFTAPLADSNKEYTLTLVVNDGTSNSPEAHVIITVLNKIELSVSEKSVSIGASTNSSASVNVHCNANWNVSCMHDWLTISPQTTNGDQILTFTASANPLYTTRIAEVVVSTLEGLSETITITQQAMVNTAPVANAGNDQTINEGDIVQLNGSASTDMDNNPLTYQWTAPEGIVLSSASDSRPTFTAPQVVVPTQYSFTLVVNDGLVNSATDVVIITVTNKIIEMYLSIPGVNFEGRESTARIILSGNAQWTASSDQPWLTVSPTSGTGDQLLLISAQSNNTNMKRTGTITFSAPGIENLTFVVTQNGLFVGIEETGLRPAFKYYPNPFSQEIAIEIANPLHKEVAVDVYTMTGQKIKSLARQRNDEYISITWNGTNELGQMVPNGMYLLKVNNVTKQVVFQGR